MKELTLEICQYRFVFFSIYIAVIFEQQKCSIFSIRKQAY